MRHRLRRVRDEQGLLEGFHDDGRALAYVDAEGSVLCAPCARKADQGQERQPSSWLPQSWFAVPDDGGDGLDDLCDSCGDPLDPRLVPPPVPATGPHAACVRTQTFNHHCPACLAELTSASEEALR